MASDPVTKLVRLTQEAVAIAGGIKQLSARCGISKSVLTAYQSEEKLRARKRRTPAVQYRLEKFVREEKPARMMRQTREPAEAVLAESTPVELLTVQEATRPATHEMMHRVRQLEAQVRWLKTANEQLLAQLGR